MLLPTVTFLVATRSLQISCFSNNCKLFFLCFTNYIDNNYIDNDDDDGDDEIADYDDEDEESSSSLKMFETVMKFGQQ